jgi:hypothetical protein
MQTNGKDIYVNIKELPLINQVQAGDFFIVETTAGTNIVDFSNIIIPPENTTFYGEIEQLQTDVDALSTLYVLQTALITTVSSILDTKIDTTSAELVEKIDNTYNVFYENFLFVQGGGSWDPTTNVSPQSGIRCEFLRTDIGSYTVIFDDTVAACNVSSSADITYVTSIAGNTVSIETYNLSYSFDVSGGSSAGTPITAIDTTLAREPVDPNFITVMAF